MSSQADQPPANASRPTEEAKAESKRYSASGQRPLPVCPLCDADNREQSRFCAQCGTALLRYCPRCGQQIALDQDLCDRCSRTDPQPAESRGRCQRCGFPNEEAAEICRKCGARLLAQCPRCSALNQASFNFCPQCGFNYSRFVTERVVHGLLPDDSQRGRSGPTLTASSALMIALMTLSVFLIIQILLQI
jgi:hypothetical protein